MRQSPFRLILWKWSRWSGAEALNRMTSGDRFDTDEARAANLENLRRLFWLRNVAISGQAVAVFAARVFLRVPIPLSLQTHRGG